jgi:repressor LexA
MLAEENIEGVYPVSTVLARPGARYFLLRARGDSMDEAGIDDGDLLLVRQQQTAQKGDRVVALIDDEATVKEFSRTAEAIVLKPCSSNRSHRSIILTQDFRVLGVVIAVLSDIE